ncbi:MAG: hypothetical protein IH805_05075, partial [Proteobacteria bacterium]|nr:hypothetical protein [Pseudomonadota bacterium]
MQFYAQPQPVASRKQTKFTAETARVFEQGERVSSHVRIAEALAARKASGQHPAECNCEAYHDVFTAARWRPQGFRPRKGTKAIRLPIFVNYETKEIDKSTGKPKTRTKRWMSFVFCKCQVDDAKIRKNFCTIIIAAVGGVDKKCVGHLGAFGKKQVAQNFHDHIKPAVGNVRLIITVIK